MLTVVHKMLCKSWYSINTEDYNNRTFFQFVHIKGSFTHFRNMVKYPFCEQTGTVGISDKVIVNLVMDRHNSDGMEARRRVIVSVSHKPYDG